MVESVLGYPAGKVCRHRDVSTAREDCFARRRRSAVVDTLEINPNGNVVSHRDRLFLRGTRRCVTPMRAARWGWWKIRRVSRAKLGGRVPSTCCITPAWPGVGPRRTRLLARRSSRRAAKGATVRLGLAGCGLQARHLEVLADLRGGALPVRGPVVGFGDAVGVGLRPQRCRAGVVARAAAPNLAGSVPGLAGGLDHLVGWRVRRGNGGK